MVNKENTQKKTNWTLIIGLLIFGTVYSLVWFWPESNAEAAATETLPQQTTPAVVNTPTITVVKDNRTIDQIIKDYIANHPSPESAANTINFDIQLPMADKEAAIAELKQKTAKSNYEASEYAARLKELEEKGLESLVDKSVNTGVDDGAVTTVNENETSETNISPDSESAIPLLQEFVLRGTSKATSGGEYRAHLIAKNKTYTVKDGDELLNRYIASISDDGIVSICEDDNCFTLY